MTPAMRPPGAEPAAVAQAGRRSGQLLAGACLVAALLLPALVAAALFVAPIEVLLQRSGVVAESLSLRSWQRAVIGTIAMLPALASAYGLWQASRCFARLARGEYFSDAVVKRLQGIGVGMLGTGFSGLIAAPLSGIVASWYAEGGHALRLNFDAGVLMPLLFGAVVWQIAAVVRRAIALAHENAQFV